MSVVSPFTISNPAINTQLGVVNNPTTAQIFDGWGQAYTIGRNGDLLASEAHGKFFAGAMRGNVFAATGAGTTGLTIINPGQTTSGLMLGNPSGSNVNLEVIEILVAPLTATNVVGGVGLEYGAPYTAVGTAVTPVRTRINAPGVNPAAAGKSSYGSTIAAMTFLQWLPLMQMNSSTLVAGGSQFLYRPDGQLVIAPGGAINIVANTTFSTNVSMQHIIWAEWPL